MQISKNIFRAYDIRGVYPKEFGDIGAFHIGKAFGTLLRRRLNKPKISVVVGRDTRNSSSVLSKNFETGLLATGCNVVDTGINLTPIIHFLTCTHDFDAGVEVTASHNPKEFNGLRMDFRNAVPLSSEDIEELYNLVTSENYEKGNGSSEELDLSEEYVKYLRSQFSFKSKLKVVIDCGHGTASFFVKNIIDSLGGNVDLVACTSDSSFPRGIPDPENPVFIANLKKLVLEHNADVGFAFDQDCDRFGVVDAKGQSYATDMLILLFARDILKSKQGIEHASKEIIFDVKCSNLLKEFVPQWGGVPTMLRTGHNFFVTAMKKGAIFGGEFSGHTFFGDKYFGYDDGIYAACRTIELLERENKPLEDLMADFMITKSTPEIKITCSDNKKFEVVEDIKKLVLEKSSEFDDVNDIDGVRVSVSSTGWFLIRPSNTNPYLSIRAEGADGAELKLILEGVISLLQKYEELDLTPLADFV
jgi:phosphomannomutase / phosphoglucomutase